MKVLTLLLVQVFSSFDIECYQMTRCELVQELRKHEFPEEKMSDWLCLVENESERKTHVIGRVNKNGSRDYGLFQINDHWWCSNTTQPAKTCKVTCVELITDDITAAANCAKIIFERQGFLAWHGWEKRCQHDLPVTEC